MAGRGMILPLTAVALVMMLAAAPAAYAEQVTIPAPYGPLNAHWLPRAGGGEAPTVIALHGCGGLYRRDGVTLAARYRDYLKRLHAAGFHVLLPDSFGSRGSGPICTTPTRERTITAMRDRRSDAIAAIEWAAQRSDVDATRIVLLGWSHGAMTALAAVDRSRGTPAQPVAATVVLYPGCAALGESFRSDVPILMLLGAKDDWTPPAPCLQVAEQLRTLQPALDLTVRVYADGYHGFDGEGPVRFRSDVPNGSNAAGVHVGGSPGARRAALAEMDAFLATRLRGRPGS